MQAVDQVPSPSTATMPPVPLHLQNSQNRWGTEQELCRNWTLLDEEEEMRGIVVQAETEEALMMDNPVLLIILTGS